jgi:hypothetical protein
MSYYFYCSLTQFTLHSHFKVVVRYDDTCRLCKQRVEVADIPCIATTAFVGRYRLARTPLQGPAK